MAGSVREKAIFYVGGRRVGPSTVGGGSTILPTAPHALDGPSHTGDLPLERISTDEIDTTVVAHPDGTGGVEFGVVAAADVTIADAGGYYTGTDVEAALQEIGAGAGPTVTGMVPYLIDTGETFTVPVSKQALFSIPITIAAGGSLVVSGYLVEVH